MVKISYRIFYLFLLIIVISVQLFAQFSPGPLSKYHAHLEGNSNCTKCHELRKKELSTGCEDCHSPLKERIDAKLGFHRDKPDKCGECHSDHNGNNFELVYWPKDIKKFDHDEAGYTLTGNHIKLECKKCHSSENIKGSSILNWAKKHTQFDVLDRTFLGLEKDCKSCHEDIHQDQVSDDCASCHNTSDWKLAVSEFDHNRARFLLTGKHKEVDCIKCHPAQPNHPKQVWQLTGMAFENCSSCHEDIHLGQVSQNCESCHNTSDWKLASNNYDHSKAKFQLTGKHQTLDCIQCHKPQLNHPQKVLQLTGLPYESCNSCHVDEFHKGVFGNACESCHSTVDWKKDIKTFDHTKTKYPLEGKHISVECSQCHKKDMPGVLPKFDTCSQCHADKHYGQFDSRTDGGDCGSCHNVNGFQPATYTPSMHQIARLRLDGAHVAIPCNQCHKPFQPKKGITTTQFTWKTVTCKMCHEDVHRNQFANNYQNKCDICHTTAIFNISIFDHQQCAFPLDGRHQSVKCRDCHKTEGDRNGTFTRYVPTPHQCSDCHTFTEEIR